MCQSCSTSAAAPSPSEAAVQPTPRADRLRVLVVDDRYDAGRALARLLSMEGHSAIAVFTAAGAVEAARSGPIDLLVCEIRLPDASGLDLLDRVRAACLTTSASHPIQGIAVTVYSTAADRAATRAAGFAAHLVKPVCWTDVLAAVDCLTGRTVAGADRVPAPVPVDLADAVVEAR